MKRSTRVAGRLQTELMELLLEGTVKDPRAQEALVSRVEVTDDLQNARVYLRFRNPLAKRENEGRAQEQMVAALQNAAGFLRREVGVRLKTKRNPSLRFFWDEQVDHRMQMDRLFAEIAADDHVSGGQAFTEEEDQ